MKKIFILFIIHHLSLSIFAQSISLDPNSLQLPRLAVSPTCAVADKGKMIYNTVQERVLYCNGTTWIDPASGSGSGSASDWVTAGSNTYLSNLTGKVGIGTTTPVFPFDILHNSMIGLRVKSSNSSSILAIDAANNEATLQLRNNGFPNWELTSFSTNDFSIVQDGGIYRLFIESTNENVGIGTSLPTQKLDINGRMRIRHNGETSGLWLSPSTNATGTSDGAFIGMETNTSAGIFIGGAWRMKLSNTGNLTISGTLTESDQRLKKEIKKVENSLAKIEALNGYNYRWIATDRDPKLQAGVLAQEVEKVMPELVNEDDTGTKSVNYVGIIPYLIESVKELSKKNEILEKELNLLKNKK
jgi:Chaperone of endosialidase